MYEDRIMEEGSKMEEDLRMEEYQRMEEDWKWKEARNSVEKVPIR